MIYKEEQIMNKQISKACIQKNLPLREQQQIPSDKCDGYGRKINYKQFKIFFLQMLWQIQN